MPLVDSISAALTNRTSKRDPEASGFLPLWGLFILHDTLKIAESPGTIHYLLEFLKLFIYLRIFY